MRSARTSLGKLCDLLIDLESPQSSEEKGPKVPSKEQLLARKIVNELNRMLLPLFSSRILESVEYAQTAFESCQIEFDRRFGRDFDANDIVYNHIDYLKLLDQLYFEINSENTSVDYDVERTSQTQDDEYKDAEVVENGVARLGSHGLACLGLNSEQAIKCPLRHGAYILLHLSFLPSGLRGRLASTHGEKQENPNCDDSHHGNCTPLSQLFPFGPCLYDARGPARDRTGSNLEVKTVFHLSRRFLVAFREFCERCDQAAHHQDQEHSIWEKPVGRTGYNRWT